MPACIHIGNSATTPTLSRPFYLFSMLPRFPSLTSLLAPLSSSPLTSAFTKQQNKQSMPSTTGTPVHSHPFHVTTIPYNFYTPASGSNLSSSSVSTRPARHSVARFFTSLCVAFGIFFLWLIMARYITLLISGHGDLPLGFRPQHEDHWRRTTPVSYPNRFTLVPI